MVAMEIWHLRGAVLDVPFLWLVVAMLNFLRLRNEGILVPGLRISCLGANLVALILEIVGWRFFGWSPYTFIAAAGFLGETIFLMVRRNDSRSAARV